MSIGHVDASSGVTGDAWLGALIDAGASLQRVQEAVDTLGIGGTRLAYAQVSRGDRKASLVRVRAPARTPAVTTWHDLSQLVSYSAVDERIRENALGVLRRLAEAEAAVTGCDTEDASFHALIAVTMATDVVAVCAALGDLGIRTMTVGPVATGTGRLVTVHGELPLPDPRVAYLLTGFDAIRGPLRDVEVTTPVGAALVAHFCRPGGPDPGADRRGRHAVGAGLHGTRISIDVRH